ncbi:MAG: hypothetical protein ABSF71_28300 [Terriglobia bacterium]|jgi:hypothetical protein
MTYVLEENLVCVLLIALLGALLFSAASVVLLARAILRAGLERVALWVEAGRQKPAVLCYQQSEQPLTHAVHATMGIQRIRLMRREE